MNTGQYQSFIARLDEMVILLEEIKLNTTDKMKPPKQRKIVKLKAGGTRLSKGNNAESQGKGAQSATAPQKSG